MKVAIQLGQTLKVTVLDERDVRFLTVTRTSTTKTIHTSVVSKDSTASAEKHFNDHTTDAVIQTADGFNAEQFQYLFQEYAQKIFGEIDRDIQLLLTPELPF
jgi:hypothetical protein